MRRVPMIFLVIFLIQAFPCEAAAQEWGVASFRDEMTGEKRALATSP